MKESKWENEAGGKNARERQRKENGSKKRRYLPSNSVHITIKGNVSLRETCFPKGYYNKQAFPREKLVKMFSVREVGSFPTNISHRYLAGDRRYEIDDQRG